MLISHLGKSRNIRANEALSKTTFDSNVSTFATWQGVTYNLTMDAIEHVFDELGNFYQGGLGIVLDYVDGRYFQE